MKMNKFVIGGFLIIGAVAFLIWNATANATFSFLTIDELNEKGSSMIDKNVKVTGAVIGDTIQYDPQSLTLTFEVAHVPADSAELETEGAAQNLKGKVQKGIGDAKSAVKDTVNKNL